MPCTDHSKEFFDVGYKTTDADRLFLDIEKGFDLSRKRESTSTKNTKDNSAFLCCSARETESFFVLFGRKTRRIKCHVLLRPTLIDVWRMIDMAFELFSKVHIKDKNVDGTIVDIYTADDGQTIYTVESQKRGYVDDPEAYTGDFPLYDMTADRLVER